MMLFGCVMWELGLLAFPVSESIAVLDCTDHLPAPSLLSVPKASNTSFYGSFFTFLSVFLACIMQPSMNPP